MTADAGSFRDPDSQVHRVDGRIYRVLKPRAKAAFEAFEASPLYQDFVGSGRLVGSERVATHNLQAVDDDDLVVEHPALPLISYPYEWPFALLKQAALHHLALQIDALDAGFVFSDASAYNIQFTSHRPVFIDVGSVRPYRDQEPWGAHHQFCEAFLAPLFLQARYGIPFQSWYRGRLEGIALDNLAPLLRWRDLLSLTVLSHIYLQAKSAGSDKAALQDTARKKAAQGLPKARYRAILEQLHHFIEGLEPKGVSGSIWGSYSTSNTYEDAETARKLEVIAAFCQSTKPSLVIDLGCNDGVFSECALRHGAKQVVGLDSDQGALNGAVARARNADLAFVPLYADLANPSPAQGFDSSERPGLPSRLGTNGSILALAVLHHMVIGRNIPMARAVAWIVGLGKSGIIEFVPKDDPTVQEMLMLREDIFQNYGRESFVQALEAQATIVSSQVISGTHREVFEYHAH